METAADHENVFIEESQQISSAKALNRPHNCAAVRGAAQGPKEAGAASALQV